MTNIILARSGSETKMCKINQTKRFFKWTFHTKDKKALKGNFPGLCSALCCFGSCPGDGAHLPVFSKQPFLKISQESLCLFAFFVFLSFCIFCLFVFFVFLYFLSFCIFCLFVTLIECLKGFKSQKSLLCQNSKVAVSDSPTDQG